MFMVPTTVMGQELDGWNLVWSDEFDQADGSLPDSTKWSYNIGTGNNGWGNGESQYYTDRAQNARIENGQLLIEMHKENYFGSPYTSARLLTQDTYEFQYGRIEARLKVPSGPNGLWPAFWMLGSNIDSVGWPQCGEIDIMEYISREPNEVFGTIHGPGYSGGDAYGSIHVLNELVSADYHTFVIEWDENIIKWFIDGEQYHQATPENLPGRQWVFNDPQFLILNLAIGGSFGGSIDPSIPFPQQYWIDYVRVYESVPDSEPPSPNPMQIVSAVGGSATTVTLTAQTATDQSSVEYYFNALSVGGHDSGWQSSPSFTDSNLLPDTRYRYSVKARDVSPLTNETAASASVEVLTALGTPLPSRILLPNGDFENGADNWVQAEAGPVNVSYEAVGGSEDNGGYARMAAYENTQWAVLVNPREAGASGGGIDIDTLGLTSGESYTFIVDLITFAGTASGGLKVEAWGNNALIDFLPDDRPSVTPSTWTTHSVDWIVPVGTEKLIFVPVWGINSTVGFDNVGVAFDPPEPAQLSEALVEENGLFIFSWDGVSNETYTIQYKENLTESGWYTYTVTNNVNGAVSIALELDLDQAFYRIISQ
jgi:beta-glucanase (GH16 family)